MDRLQFFTPVRISRGQGKPVEEIDSVSEAMVFFAQVVEGAARGRCINAR